MSCCSGTISTTQSLNAPDSCLVVFQGESTTFEIAVIGPEGAFDLTGSKIYFTVKRRWRDDVPVLLKRTLNAGGSDAEILVLPSPSVGKAQIYIAPIDTTSLSNDDVDDSGSWVCDCWIVTSSNQQKIVLKMRPFVVMQTVTDLV